MKIRLGLCGLCVCVATCICLGGCSDGKKREKDNSSSPNQSESGSEVGIDFDENNWSVE